MTVRLIVSPVTVIVQVNTGGGGSGEPVTFENVNAALAEADADIDINGQEVINAADPTTAQSLATRAYVDANASGVGSRIELATNDTLTNTDRGNTYVGTGMSLVVATLPASGTIASGFKWSNRFVVASEDGLRLLCQGADELLYYGINGGSLTSLSIGDVIDIEYVGGGVYNVAGVVGQGWSFP